MSTSCATAAPTRHPPGEAHAAPAALPLPTRVAQVAATSGYLGGAAARGSTTSEPNRRPPVAPSPRDNTTGDAPTPTRPTTSALCRQKRIRRHQATRDSTPRRCREPFATGGDQWRGSSPVAKGSRHPQRHHPHQVQQLSIESTWSMSAKNYWQTLARVGRHGTLGFPAAAAPPPPRPSWPKTLGQHGRHGRVAKTRRSRSLPPSILHSRQSA